MVGTAKLSPKSFVWAVALSFGKCGSPVMQISVHLRGFSFLCSEKIERVKTYSHYAHQLSSSSLVATEG